MQMNIPPSGAFEHILPLILLDLEELHSTVDEFIMVVIKFIMISPFERVWLLQHFDLYSLKMITAIG